VPSTRAKRQTLALTVPEETAWTNVDADRMQEVFTNLLSNASKFSEEDSPISITLSLDGEDYA